jgi:hypothetical protein
MSGACSTKGGDEERMQGFDGNARRKETTRKEECSMEWFDLAQDRDQWRPLVMAIVKLWVQ